MVKLLGRPHGHSMRRDLNHSRTKAPAGHQIEFRAEFTRKNSAIVAFVWISGDRTVSTGRLHGDVIIA